MTDIGDATVITGSGDSNDSAAAWAKAALDSCRHADHRRRHAARDRQLGQPSPPDARHRAAGVYDARKPGG